ncbi:MAG: hypothetical protein RLZ55_1615 [Actinomycetota bacterium]
MPGVVHTLAGSTFGPMPALPSVAGMATDAPNVRRRLATALGVPIVATEEPDAPPQPELLRSAPRLRRARPWILLLAVLTGLSIIAGMAVLAGRPREVPAGMQPAAAGASAPAGLTAAGAAASAAASGAVASGTGLLVVHVAGAVARPGMVQLPTGARVGQAIDAAGGAVPGAVLTSVNLARRVTDGEQIVVPLAGDTPLDSVPVDPVPSSVQSSTKPGVAQPGAATGAPSAGAPSGGVVNLNTASSAELEDLPRVGPATAAKIIEYRERNGPFTAVDQLLDVPGIGERTLEGLRDRVRV